VGGDEPGDGVFGPAGTCDADQGVFRGAASTHIGLRMTRYAGVGIEPRPKAVALGGIGAADHLNDLEARQPIIEVVQLVLAEAWQRGWWPAVGQAVTYAGVAGLRLDASRRKGGQGQQKRPGKPERMRKNGHE